MASTPYKHFVPPVPLNPDYDKNLTYVLIENLDQLKESFKKGYVIAWDTETTGLNPVVSEIVGFSYTYDGVTGYYCPVKHFDLSLGKAALDLFYQALKDSKLQLLYNARFDIRMMEYSGYDMSFMYQKDLKTNSSKAVFIDVMNQVWLSDTNIPLPSLKSSTLHFLGYQPPKFLETLGDEQNFQYVPAKDAYRYACFTEDTLIQTKHGLKQIKDLRDGDLITTSTGYHRLLSILPQGRHKVIKVTTPQETSFTCTSDHKFAFRVGQDIFWVQAKDLDKIPFYFFYRGGDSLNNVTETLNSDEPYQFTGEVCTIEYIEDEQEVYDLSVEEEHNFILQCGLIAHNCLDAINTYNLFKVTYKYYKESGLAAQMDNACVYIIGQLEKQPLNIDTDYLVSLRDKVYNRVLELEKEIYAIAGHEFKIGSNRELTQVFLEQGIDTGERTKAGDMKTGIELLNLYLRNHPECRLLHCLIEYKEQFKFYNSYLKTLVDIAKQQDTVPPRFSYKLQSVPCLTENNLVLVKDKGIIHIPQVEENDLIWTQYGYKRVLWCNSHKSDNIYRIIFDNSLFIEGTAHHPVLVNKGTETDVRLEWATLESLNIGEKVIFNHHIPSMQYSMDVKDQEYTKYLEYLGFLSSPYIEPNAKYLNDYIQTKEELLNDASKDFRKLTSLLTDSIDNLLELVAHSKPYQWVSFLQGLFYGIFETDVAKQWNTDSLERFIIRSRQPIFLTLVMNLFYYLGIPNTLCYDEYSYYLELSSTQALTLFNVLIVSDSQSDYLKDLFHFYNPSGYYTEYADSIVSKIEKLEGEQTVYDIEVEDVHEYVANGVVTHNTGRLSCGKDGKNSYFAPINLQCLEENTLIKTDRGDIPIKKVTDNDLVWTGNRYTYCKQLGSKKKEVYLVETLWGKIEASLEHNFLSLNPSNWSIEWHSLDECIINHYPLLRDPQSLGSSFDEIYSCFSLNRKTELDLKEYKSILDYYKDTKFDLIQDVLNQGVKTVFDLYVPEYNQFAANGFIVHNSLPKPKSIKCYGRKATQEEIDNYQDTLGWIFSPDHPEWSPGKVVEGMNQNLNVRSAFLPEHPENGDYIISIDMSAEELKIVTNLFHETSWAKIINAGGDLHHANSDAIFGPENYTKETRKKAKGAAFGMLYGQEYRGFQRKFPDMSLDEAKEFMIKFKKTIPNIVRGQDRMIKEARRTGTFYSGFGRPRRVKHYLTSSDYKDVAFGERTIKNSPIQSTAADVLKLEFIRLWDNIFTEYPEIKFVCTIHDEINYSVPRSLAKEVIPKMIRCMTVKMPRDLVELTCSLSAGHALGDQFPFKYNFETKEFEPDWEEDVGKKKEIYQEENKIEESFDEETEDIIEDSIEDIDSKMFDF